MNERGCYGNKFEGSLLIEQEPRSWGQAALDATLGKETTTLSLWGFFQTVGAVALGIGLAKSWDYLPSLKKQGSK
jgi:hypothetical protein